MDYQVCNSIFNMLIVLIFKQVNVAIGNICVLKEALVSHNINYFKLNYKNQ